MDIDNFFNNLTKEIVLMEEVIRLQRCSEKEKQVFVIAKQAAKAILSGKHPQIVTEDLDERYDYSSITTDVYLPGVLATLLSGWKNKYLTRFIVSRVFLASETGTESVCNRCGRPIKGYGARYVIEKYHLTCFGNSVTGNLFEPKEEKITIQGVIQKAFEGDPAIEFEEMKKIILRDFPESKFSKPAFAVYKVKNRKKSVQNFSKSAKQTTKSEKQTTKSENLRNWIAKKALKKVIP